MTLNHRKKNSRHRGSWTHSYGEKKKHRGAGSRGGRGRAGSGKRGDAKKPRYWSTERSGKYGFKNPNAKDVTTITISMINTALPRWEAQGLAKKEGSTYNIDLSALGFDKLLATGTPTAAYSLVVKEASSRAQEKIEAAKGSVTLPNASSQEIVDKNAVSEEKEPISE